MITLTNVAKHYNDEVSIGPVDLKIPAGGVTALVDMPLNSIPPTTTVPHLDAKRAAARGQCWVDVAFWGGVIPGNQVRCR